MPFSWIYWILTSIRNGFFDLGILKQTSFDVPVICVGNISVGGTGKTPMIEWLLASLGDHHAIGVISRGYGRSSKGFLTVELSSTAHEVGDEPLQLKANFPTTDVVVCENRVAGIRQMLKLNPSIDLILMDDGFQHRHVKPHLSIILSEYQRPFYTDFLMPAGRLRETRNAYKRAHAVVFTKCPSGFEKLDTPIRNIPVFYSHVAYQPAEIIGEVVGFSGLANNSVFEEYLRKTYDVKSFFSFGDHHSYSQSDFDKLQKASEGKCLVCTEKDAVKLKQFTALKNLKVIKINATFDSSDFETWLKKSMN